ncbi:MAG TPA: kelch repeat-containing protein, partial [Polyangiaceae bacterium]
MKQLGIAEAARAARGRLIPYLLAVTALSFFGLGCSSGRPEAAPGPESVATRQERVQGLNEMRDARFRHSATLLADGTVLVAGGASTFDPNKIGLGTDALASAELYLSSYAGFVSVPDMAVARWAHTATLLRDGTVLIAGGFDKDGNALAATELYDPDAQQFKRGPDLAAARGLHTATLLADGRVLIMGGASDDTFGSAVDAGEVYDPVTATLTTLDHQGATVPSAAVL